MQESYVGTAVLLHEKLWQIGLFIVEFFNMMFPKNIVFPSWITFVSGNYFSQLLLLWVPSQLKVTAGHMNGKPSHIAPRALFCTLLLKCKIKIMLDHIKCPSSPASHFPLWEAKEEQETRQNSFSSLIIRNTPPLYSLCTLCNQWVCCHQTQK